MVKTVYSNDGDTTKCHRRYWNVWRFCGMYRVRGFALMAKSMHALWNPEQREMGLNASQRTIVQDLTSVFACHKAYFILLKAALLHHLIPLFLEGDDDESYKDVDEKEGEDNKVDDVEDWHFHPVAVAWTPVFFCHIYRVLQNPAERRGTTSFKLSKNNIDKNKQHWGMAAFIQRYRFSVWSISLLQCMRNLFCSVNSKPAALNQLQSYNIGIN